MRRGRHPGNHDPPFSAGSSLSHVQLTQDPDTSVDIALKNNYQHPLQDFLMLWIGNKRSLGELIKLSSTLASGIEPGIKSTLIAMGYTDAKSDTWNSRKNHAAIVEAALRPVGWQGIEGYLQQTTSAASSASWSASAVLAVIVGFWSFSW
ncbi:hypothetical protein BC828DRAFT_382864 [Blastocladiella britannica]|nr:hypothetical protein BC828DRAFT_382864 [Blastocladiella britannica]